MKRTELKELYQMMFPDYCDSNRPRTRVVDYALFIFRDFRRLEDVGTGFLEGNRIECSGVCNLTCFKNNLCSTDDIIMEAACFGYIRTLEAGRIGKLQFEVEVFLCNRRSEVSSQILFNFRNE